MNEEILERLRDPQLRPALRGYDRLEVEALLHDVADLIEARGLGLPAGQKAVGELPGVAERVESIIRSATEAAEHVGNEAGKRAAELTQEAEQAAEHMRREADGYATETREAADRYAAETRTGAEADARKLREESSRMAEATTAAAEEQAAEILREAELERDRVKASIAELRQQREQVIQSIERMRGSLDSMVGDVEKGTEQFIAVGGAGVAATSALAAQGEPEPAQEPQEPDLEEAQEPSTKAAEGERAPEPVEQGAIANGPASIEEYPAVEQQAVVEGLLEEEEDELAEDLDELEREAEAEAELDAEEPLTGEEELEERRPGEGVSGVVFDDEEDDDDDIVYPTDRDETQPYTTEDFDSLEQPADEEWVGEAGEDDGNDGEPATTALDGETEVLELPDDRRRRKG